MRTSDPEQPVGEEVTAGRSSAFAAGGVASAECPVSRRLPTSRDYAAEWLLSSAAKDGTRPKAEAGRLGKQTFNV